MPYTASPLSGKTVRQLVRPRDAAGGGAALGLMAVVGHAGTVTVLASTVGGIVLIPAAFVAGRFFAAALEHWLSKKYPDIQF